jgi:hypothetical protein
MGRKTEISGLPELRKYYQEAVYAPIKNIAADTKYPLIPEKRAAFGATC